ncbi:MAG: hypothetical protein HY868_21360 [Chloroflexi bacterium]|nr:hypothetical protein [Chloroflexota bacterium]
MNLEQVTQRVTWLDEEHRKDKAQIAEVGNQLTSQYSQIAGLVKTTQDLEERIARLQSQSLRYSQIEQATGQVKTEVQIILEQADKRRLAAEEEQFKIRQAERERMDQILSALQMQIEALQQFQRGIIGDHDVLNRLDLAFGTLQREVEDAIRRDEALNQRISVVEEWVPRTGQLMTEVHQLGDRLRQERADAAEAARRAEQSRARHMAEWAEQMKTSRREIEEWLAQMRGIQEKYKEDRKIFAPLQEMEERLKQTEARLLQWQRLVEETRRKEREQIIADIEKRWQQQLGEWQFMRDEWNKRIAVVSDRITKLEDWRPEVATQLHELVERIEKERRERMVLLSNILRALIEAERKRYVSQDRMLEDILNRVEGEKPVTKSRKVANPAGD